MPSGEDTYSHLELEAALCVWECLNDWTILDEKRLRPDWNELREGVGSVELRHQSIALGKWCLSVYDIVTATNRDFFDGYAYDWEVIPLILDFARDAEGFPVIYSHAFPDASITAQHVIREHCFEVWRGDCRSEAARQWGYADLTSDYADRLEAAFVAGENPADFIRWLGEKYDLTPATAFA